jgi:hypothetical protein
MWAYKSLIIVLSVLALAASAYWRFSTRDLNDLPVKRDKPFAGDGASDETRAPLEDGVFFQVGGIKIMAAEVQAKFDSLVRLTQKNEPGFQPDARQGVQMQKNIAIKILSGLLLEKFAADKKLEAPKKEELEERLSQLKKSVAESGQNYEQMLAENCMSDGEVRRVFQTGIAVENELLKSVTDADLKKFHDPKDPAIRRASHIWVAFKGVPNADKFKPPVTRSKEEAKARVEEALKKLKDGASFADIAAAYSDDPSTKTRGGDLDYVARGDKGDKALFESLYALEKAGDLSGPVESAHGWHILKLTGIRASDEARKEALLALAQIKVGELAQKLLDEHRPKGKFNSKLVPPERPKPAPTPMRLEPEEGGATQ